MNGPRMSRRSLLRSAGIAGAAAATGSLPTTSASADPKPTLVDPATPRDARPGFDSCHQHLVFSDEFDLPQLDTSKWTTRDQPRGDGNHGITYSYSSQNVSIEHGALALAISRVTDNAYAGSRIDCQGKFDFTYGTIEYRIHVPPVEGHMAAAWLQASDGLSTTATSAAKGVEIDIAETYSQADQYGANLHWGGYGPTERSMGSVVTAPGLHGSSRYHTFGLEWTPSHMRFTYDDTVVWTVTDPMWISQVNEFAIASHEIIAYAQGDIHNATLGPASTMYVDYIRVWQ